MKTLYIDGQMGAAGDMLMAALMELVDDQEAFLDTMNGLGIPGLQVSHELVEKCGTLGNQVHVCIGQEHHHEHHHCLGDITTLIDQLNTTDAVKKDAKAVYQIIAGAEAIVHETDIEHVHFHEVGSLDAVADVVGVCLLMNEIHPDEIIVSPIHVGSGTVKCAHGILSVPTPATAKILEAMPIYGGEIEGELCTPTGAALLKYFGQTFGPCPEMDVEKTGRGMGTKEFPGHTNGIGVFLGQKK